MAKTQKDSGTISIKEFLLHIMQEQGKTIDLRFDSLDKSIILSRDEMNRRLEGLNQLRNEVLMDRSMFMPRETCATQHKDLTDWREAINNKVTILETRAITWTAAVGIFFLFINVVLRWFGK